MIEIHGPGNRISAYAANHSAALWTVARGSMVGGGAVLTKTLLGVYFHYKVGTRAELADMGAAFPASVGAFGLISLAKDAARAIRR